MSTYKESIWIICRGQFQGKMLTIKWGKGRVVLPIQIKRQTKFG